MVSAGCQNYFCNWALLPKAFDWQVLRPSPCSSSVFLCPCFRLTPYLKRRVLSAGLAPGHKTQNSLTTTVANLPMLVSILRCFWKTPDPDETKHPPDYLHLPGEPPELRRWACPSWSSQGRLQAPCTNQGLAAAAAAHAPLCSNSKPFTSWESDNWTAAVQLLALCIAELLPSNTERSGSCLLYTGGEDEFVRGLQYVDCIVCYGVPSGSFLFQHMLMHPLQLHIRITQQTSTHPFSHFHTVTAVFSLNSASK